MKAKLMASDPDPRPAPPRWQHQPTCSEFGYPKRVGEGLCSCDGVSAAAAPGIAPPIQLQLTEAEISGLVDYVNFNGAAHTDECPADDTCDCIAKPMNDAVNSICQKACDAQVKR